MAEYPALPLWTDAYFGDTRHLSTLQHGAYLLLLMEAWRRPSCSLPDDDELLARLSCLSIDEWRAIRDVVLAFWEIDGRSKEWRQKRLSKERVYVSKNSKVQRDKAAKRWNKTKKDNAAAMPDGMPDECREVCRTDAPTPTPTPTPIEESLSSDSSGAAAGLDLETATERVLMAIGNPNLISKFWSNGQAKGRLITELKSILASGADLHADVLPVITERATQRGYEPGNIGSIAYFATAIGQRRAKASGVVVPINSAKPRRRFEDPKYPRDMEAWNWLDALADKGIWYDSWGPLPGEPQCVIPGYIIEHIRAEMPEFRAKLNAALKAIAEKRAKKGAA